MKPINLELSKRLNDLGLLDNINTKYIYRQKSKGDLYNNNPFITHGNFYNTDMSYTDYKTLTLEEAIDILPKKISFEDYDLFLFLDFFEKKLFYGLYSDLDEYNISFKYKETILEAVEAMIEYLLDNNLLGQ